MSKINARIAEYLNFNKSKKHFRKAFIFGTGIVLLIALLLAIGGEWLLLNYGWATKEQLEGSWWINLLILLAVSCIIGTVLSYFAGKIVLKPMEDLMDGMAKLASGDYTARLDFGDNESMKSFSDAFNALAKELQSTEILRSDFINNFSHEFKTPVASIIGLIKLMETGRMPKEKQKEYLSIIKEEANRLSDMTANVLNLSKIESQNILTDQTVFNLSEQIRTCVLLLEKNWTNKDLHLSLEFEEYEICGNESMLKQVWLNLLDNAVKFSNTGGELEVRIQPDEQGVAVFVLNTGEAIREEDREKIFHKFYQADTTHSKEGNGIGLSIVKHIVDLHKGKVAATSENGKTCFIVTLPRT